MRITCPIRSLCLAITLLASVAAEARPVIMLTGYWPPTGDMVRRFSRNPEQNPKWVGENWEARGYDVQSYFPEFPEGSGSVGEGDFEVEWDDTKADFERITAAIRPIAIVSFGLGDGPWEIETRAPDVRGDGPALRNSLPAFAIERAVDSLGEIDAWVDRRGTAGTYLCGYLSWLGADYRRRHSSRSDPARILMQGFIHVGWGHAAVEYERAVDATLRALIEALDSGAKDVPRTSAWPSLRDGR